MNDAVVPGAVMSYEKKAPARRGFFAFRRCRSISISRLALRNHGACEPPCAAVGKAALPVQSSTAARPLHFLISGMAKLSASAHSATEDETKAA
jgi:hypothetical protein